MKTKPFRIIVLAIVWALVLPVLMFTQRPEKVEGRLVKVDSVIAPPADFVALDTPDLKATEMRLRDKEAALRHLTKTVQKQASVNEKDAKVLLEAVSKKQSPCDSDMSYAAPVDTTSRGRGKRTLFKRIRDMFSTR